MFILLDDSAVWIALNFVSRGEKPPLNYVIKKPASAESRPVRSTVFWERLKVHQSQKAVTFKIEDWYL